MTVAALFEPRTMNVIIMGLYTINVMWWLAHGKPWDAGYWAAAFAITFVVTFGYGR